MYEVVLFLRRYVQFLTILYPEINERENIYTFNRSEICHI